MIKFGEILDSVNLYRPVKKFLNYLVHPQILRNELDVQVDILQLKRATASWKQKVGAPSCTMQIDCKIALIISMTNVPFLAKAHAFLAIGLREHGYRPVILCLSNSHWAQRYFSIFGLKEFIFWDEYSQDSASDAGYAENIVEDFLASNPEIQDFKMWQFHGVNVGKLALSTMIRRQLKGQFDLKDISQFDNLRQWLTDTVSNVLAAEKLFERYPVEKIIARDAGYTPSGVIYEIGLNRGIDAIRLENAQMMGQWMVKRYNLDNRGQALFSLSPDTWKGLCEIPLTPDQDQALTDDFVERYNPDSKRDLYQYQQGKQNLLRQDVISLLELDPKKKTAVIFAHISWDANFFDGEDLFDDFEHWLVETVKIACHNPCLNWVVKLHPANVYKLQRENSGRTEETEMVALRRLGNLPDHVKIMHANTPINTWSLFPVIDYGLTVRGTIGMELPCFGIPIVTAGTGRYSGYGFTVDPPNRAAYTDCLLNLQSVPRLDLNQVALARRHAYWVFLHRQASFDEFSKMSSQVLKDPNHPLHHNLQISTQFHDDFINAPKFQAFMEWMAKGSESDFILLEKQCPGF